MLLYNGHLLRDDEFALKLPNRGLFFNDGFFETMVWTDGSIRYLGHHVARLRRAAAALHLQLPAALAEPAALTQALAPLVAAAAADDHSPHPARLRLQLWRNGGGLYTPETNTCAWLVTAQPFAANDTAVTNADFAETVRTHYSPVSFCKGPNALVYVLAAQERQQRRLGELLLLDAAGHVAESVAAAVFWIKDGELFTPALETGCVAGVRRAHLLQIAQQQGLVTHEILSRPAEVQAAETVFTANVAGIRVIQQLGGVELLTEHPVLQQLREWEQIG